MENEDTWLSKLKIDSQNRSTGFCVEYTEFAFFPHRDRFSHTVQWTSLTCKFCFLNEGLIGIRPHVSREFCLMHMHVQNKRKFERNSSQEEYV